MASVLSCIPSSLHIARSCGLLNRIHLLVLDFHHHDKIPEQSYLQEFILAHGLRHFGPSWWNRTEQAKAAKSRASLHQGPPSSLSLLFRPPFRDRIPIAGCGCCCRGRGRCAPPPREARMRGFLWAPCFQPPEKEEDRWAQNEPFSLACLWQGC